MPSIVGKLFPTIYWKKSVASNRVHLTFDDGPDQNYTLPILNILKEENAMATFFVLGAKALQNQKLVRQIHQGGHEIGIHSFIHERLLFQSEKHICKQLNTSKHIVEGITGQSVRFFRPPFGVFSPRLINICEKLNLKLVLWRFMTYDFDPRISTATILKLIDRKVTGGEILVLHDGHANSHRTVQILKPAIRTLKKKGLKLVSLCK